MQDSAPNGKQAPARVFEGTSGSTGISLALIGRALGAATRVWLPDDTAESKVTLLHRVGADVTQVPNVSIVSSQHYVNLAREAARKDAGAVFADQFETPSNVAVHYDTTGPEIWAQTGQGQLDAFVCGAGTGGTIAGVSQYLKEASGGRVHIALADPPGSSLYNWAAHGTAFAPQQAERSIRRHRYDTVIEGVGLDRVTANLSLAVIDSAHTVTDQEALDMSRYLLQEEGLFIGSSSAMNAAAAVKVARAHPPGAVVMTLLCDHGSRHLSRFWNDEYCTGVGLAPPTVMQPGETGAGGEGQRVLPSGSVDFIA